MGTSAGVRKAWIDRKIYGYARWRREQRTCPRCGAIFTPTFRVQKYCTQECYHLHRTELVKARTEKLCKKCGRMLPATTEYFNLHLRPTKKNPTAEVLQAYCRDCHREKSKQWYDQHGIDEQRNRLGIPNVTPGPGDSCAISGQPFVPNIDRRDRLVPDHDHGTGVFRGLITDRLNGALGFFERQAKIVGVPAPELLRRAAVYLEQSEPNHKEGG